MKTLIARLEAATGPDRGLDAEIGALIGDHDSRVYLARSGMPDQHFVSPPLYTESIDAAMTLVPKVFDDGLMGWGDSSQCTLYNHNLGVSVIVDGDGATPSLALCIAALKAREANYG